MLCPEQSRCHNSVDTRMKCSSQYLEIVFNIIQVRQISKNCIMFELSIHFSHYYQSIVM